MSHSSTLARARPEMPVNLPANKLDPEYNSDIIVDLLAKMDVEYVFLLPGSSYRGLHDSLVNFGRNHKPTVILAMHEQIAVAMAHGYSKASGKTGVAILHNLVGLMNGCMGVYNAYADHVPLLILGGSGPFDPAERRWIDWLHCASTQSDIVKSYVKWTSEPPTIQSTLDSMARGFKIAGAKPQGPVYMTIDCAVQERPLESGVSLPDARLWQSSPPIGPNEDTLARAADLLVNAKFPLIVGGRIGIDRAASEPLTALVEASGAAYRDDLWVVAMPTAHPQNLTGDRSLLADADVVVAIDCRDVASLMGGYATEKKEVGRGSAGPADRKLIDISLNELAVSSWSDLKGSQTPIDLQLTCDPMLGLRRLTEAVQQRVSGDAAAKARIDQRRRTLAERHQSVRKAQMDAARKDIDSQPITTQRLVLDVYDAVKDKKPLLAVRNHSSFPEGLWQFTGSGQYLGHSGGGGTGYGPGAAVGAALACRERGQFCVAILGDGDYGLYASAVWSAVHYRVPLLIVLNNNNSWGNDEKHQLDVAADRGRPLENAWIGQKMVDPAIDHGMTARSYGAWAPDEPVTDPAKLAEVLRRAVAEVEQGAVAVVDVRTKLA